jgi:integrase/recombinase XerD
VKRQSLLFEIELFLTRYLPNERKLTRTTILSYRDTLKLFLQYCIKQNKVAEVCFEIELIKHNVIVSFLNDIELSRQAKISTRNQRLAALKSFVKFLLFRNPEFSDSLSRVFAIPFKKDSRKIIHYLNEEEISAFLSCCSGGKWIESRDSLIFEFLIQTGVRISELTSLKIEDLILSHDPFVKVLGKGRKERAIPLEKKFSKKLKNWISKNKSSNCPYMFSTINRTILSSDAVQFALRKYMDRAKGKLKSLKTKHITVHSLRHTTAMRMLNKNVDIYIIALWLGHEKISTTEKYLSESLTLKKKALGRLPKSKLKKMYQRKVAPMDFLDEL